MQIDLTGKKALVTGASRGLGRAIALSLARAGADVVITYEKSVDKAQAVADEIKATGRYGEAVQADSASAQAIQDAVTHAARSLGGLDILVNNAGIARGGPLESMTLADIDALINVNIRGVVIATGKRWCIWPMADVSSTSAAVWLTAWPCRASRFTP